MSYHSEDREVLQFLREQLNAARIEYTVASAEFDLLVKDVPDEFRSQMALFASKRQGKHPDRLFSIMCGR